jgi:hypothetical protein
LIAKRRSDNQTLQSGRINDAHFFKADFAFL